MGYHHCRKPLLLNDAGGELQYLRCGGGVQRGSVLIEQEELEKKLLKEKLKAEILAELEAQTKVDSEAEEKETTEE